MTWGECALGAWADKKKGYDWDHEFDVGCKITKTASLPNRARTRINLKPLLIGCTQQGAEAVVV